MLNFLVAECDVQDSGALVSKSSSIKFTEGKRERENVSLCAHSVGNQRSQEPKERVAQKKKICNRCQAVVVNCNYKMFNRVLPQEKDFSQQWLGAGRRTMKSVVST